MHRYECYQVSGVQWVSLFPFLASVNFYLVLPTYWLVSTYLSLTIKIMFMAMLYMERTDIRNELGSLLTCPNFYLRLASGA